MRTLSIRTCLYLLMALNAMDAIFTVYWVKYRFIQELNPLMSYALGQSLALFLLIKILIVAGSSFLLWRCRTHKWAMAALFITTPTYMAVIGWHVWGFLLGAH